MTPFDGFSESPESTVSLPEQFFSQLLPEIDSLAELKLTLFVFWLLEHTEGALRYVRKQDLLAQERLLDLMHGSAQEAREDLELALANALQRGTLLEVKLTAGEGQETLYFLNSPGARAAIKAIEKGEWRSSGNPYHPVDLDLLRPNIFRLYEDNIGPLTPMIAEILQDAENTYPQSWIEEAIRIAVENNKRNWRYVEAILRRWQEGGRDEREDRRDTEKSLRRYKEWENSSG